MLFCGLYLCIVAFTAVIMDLKSGRVDNRFLFCCLFADLAFLLSRFGCEGFLHLTRGVLLPFLLLFPLFLFHMLGAGDIKLFCVICPLLSVGDGLRCIFYAFFSGALISLGIMLGKHCLISRFRYLFRYLKESGEEKRRKPYRAGGMERMENFHFTIPVLVSVLLYAAALYGEIGLL